MEHIAGIWVDHKKAVIVSVSAGGVSVKTLHSEVGSHPHYAGSHEGGGEKKYEERHNEHLDKYYDEVIGLLGHPEALLILGPGEAKLQFKARLSHVTALATCRVEVEAADKLTDPQIVAKVKEHFGLVR